MCFLCNFVLALLILRIHNFGSVTEAYVSLSRTRSDDHSQFAGGRICISIRKVVDFVELEQAALLRRRTGNARFSALTAAIASAADGSLKAVRGVESRMRHVTPFRPGRE